MNLDDLACSVFDFLTPIVRTTKGAASLANGEKGDERGTGMMESVVGLVLEYIQVTRANVSKHLSKLVGTRLMNVDEGRAMA